MLNDISQTETLRQTLYDVSYLWNLKKNQTYQSHRHREQWWLPEAKWWRVEKMDKLFWFSF